MQTGRKQLDTLRLLGSTARWVLALFASAAPGLFGCNLGGQTGTELTPSDKPTDAHRGDGDDTGPKGGGVNVDDMAEGAFGSQCDRHATVIDLGDAEELGFSAEHVLDMAEGVREASLAWAEPASFERAGASGTFGPVREDDSIRVTVIYDEGAVRLVQYTPKEQKDAGSGLGDFAIDPQCPKPRLEIEVGVELETSGGALDEAFDAVLVSSNPRSASVSKQLASDKLDGSFEVELSDVPSEAGLTVGPIDVQVIVYSGGMTGTLSSSFEMKTKDIASAGMVQYAHWPAEDPCTQSSFNPNGVGGVPVPLDEPLDGVSAAEVLTDIESLSGLPVTWQDDSETEASLVLSARTTSACLSLDDSATLLWIPVDITLETADGRVDAVLPGTVSVKGSVEFESKTLTIAGSVRCESDDPAVECGWPEIDAGAYDALTMELILDGDQPATADTLSGTLTLTGSSSAPCPEEPAEPAPDDRNGVSSSGCAGEQVTEIETGAMGAP